MSWLTLVLNLLLALACVVLAYLVTVWVLGLLGLAVPAEILKVCFVILALLAVLGALSGKWTWWQGPPA